MVVDGRYEFVGSDRVKARQSITLAARNQKASIELERERSADDPAKPGLLKIRINRTSAVGTTPVDVLLAVTESDLKSNVLRGENRGRQLPHVAVVRSLSRVGALQGTDARFTANLRIDSGWRQDKLRAVVFLQDPQSRFVQGAATIDLGE
jgi:hypothetical protein